MHAHMLLWGALGLATLYAGAQYDRQDLIDKAQAQALAMSAAGTRTVLALPTLARHYTPDLALDMDAALNPDQARLRLTRWGETAARSLAADASASTRQALWKSCVERTLPSTCELLLGTGR